MNACHKHSTVAENVDCEFEIKKAPKKGAFCWISIAYETVLYCNWFWGRPFQSYETFS